MPEGILIGWSGDGNNFDHEPLMRSAWRCLSRGETSMLDDAPPFRFVEFVFVVDNELVVIQRGRRAEQLVLAVVCTREANLRWVLESTRRAIIELENGVNLREFGLAS
ncbi:MAG: hypothetical protein ABW133_04835 [Polyangiaceae bacterium]